MTKQSTAKGGGFNFSSGAGKVKVDTSVATSLGPRTAGRASGLKVNKPFGLYAILTDPVLGYETCARAVVEEGVKYLQLRMKDTPKQAVLETAIKLREITRGTDTLFIVNDDVDIAMESDADGVHLGQSDLSLSEARKIWTIQGKQFGLSTHTEQEAKDALQLKPDYIGVGPVFPTPTKAKPDPDIGLNRMGAIIKDCTLPAVAIGGINLDNLHQVLSHGAENFCVVRAITQSKEPRKAIQKMMHIWKSYMNEKTENI